MAVQYISQYKSNNVEYALLNRTVACILVVFVYMYMCCHSNSSIGATVWSVYAVLNCVFI